MFLFDQVRQDQPLPVQVQYILAACCGKRQSTAPLCRFQQKMYLRIVAQWLKMPDTLDSIFDGLSVHDISRTKFHFHVKSVPNHPF